MVSLFIQKNKRFFIINKSFRSDLACQIALDAVQTVMIDENGRREIDTKRYARFEKVCCLINL
jgi:hypothetical protein